MQLAFKPRLSVDAYLAGELISDTRHEYIDGEVYAMTASSESHNLIALNVASRLRSLVRGGPCRVFISVLSCTGVRKTVPGIWLRCLTGPPCRWNVSMPA